jgi:hypothetical protein
MLVLGNLGPPRRLCCRVPWAAEVPIAKERSRAPTTKPTAASLAALIGAMCRHEDGISRSRRTLRSNYWSPRGNGVAGNGLLLHQPFVWACRDVGSLPQPPPNHLHLSLQPLDYCPFQPNQKSLARTTALLTPTTTQTTHSYFLPELSLTICLLVALAAFRSDTAILYR